jgi:precorrin-6Y C5,15-methyltransferase (decarboxylating)
VPGLPDRAYESDGALTKRHVRAATVAALAPTPGGLLWDIGAGSGSIAIEWLRAERSARAIAVEAREDRAERIARNATKLGVPSLNVVVGDAPAVLAELDPPDAVFIGGGLTTPGVLDTAWEALAAGGRIAANAVTLEGEQTLIAAQATHGGDLVKFEISHAEPIGAFTAWRPALPVVQWSSEKP